MLERQFNARPPRSYNNFLTGLQQCGEPSQEHLPPPALLPGPAPHAGCSLLHQLPAAPNGLRCERHHQLEQQWPAMHAPLLKAGEAAALSHLHAVCADAEWVSTFSKPDTNPLCVVRCSAEKQSASTSLLSPYLAHGNLSPRVAYWTIHSAVERYKGKKKTKPPQSLLAQLLWRDFFHFEAMMVGSSFTTEQNRQCLRVEWSSDAEHLAAWEAGRTGVPLVDAGMTQLVATGWMHHIARHVCACFLTRGALWVDWQQGAAVFARHLLDHDPAVNAGNWQWLAGCNYFYTYNRIYNFESFGRRHDPQGRFIASWLPFIKSNAPYALARDVGGSTDYPTRPIVDLKLAREDNLHRMDLAFVRATESVLADVPAHAWQELRRERGVTKGAQGEIGIQQRANTNGPTSHHLPRVLPQQSNTGPLKVESITKEKNTTWSKQRRTKAKSRVQGAWKISRVNEEKVL